MLQPMSSLASGPVDEVAVIARTGEGRLCGDVSSEASSDAADDCDLPQCKIRRNYNCAKCTFFTQNPRAYLSHTRDVHFEKFKIYDCPRCVYASRHHQKLLRHIKMVHATPAVKVDVDSTQPARADRAPAEVPERIEDLLEEVEDTLADDALSDGRDDPPERPPDAEPGRTRDDTAPTAASTVKDKSKFFSCNKCNYVTHLRARFTKHVKYHSMPMIKCTLCDFRTPYKWNLDRHMKNHGGGGGFCCSMCNFTADIKQSLTVHEMNHHTPPVGHSSAGRRRNRVGASTAVAAPPTNNDDDDDEGSGDSHSSHSVTDVGQQYVELAEMSSNSGTESNDAIITSVQKGSSPTEQEYMNQQTSAMSNEESESQKSTRKRPIPQLIPLNASTPNQNIKNTTEPVLKRFKDMVTNGVSDSDSTPKIENLPADVTLIPIKNSNTTKEHAPRKKNNSFFDKLKERILTETGAEGSLVCKNCGFESKCLSEHSVHEKNCTSHSSRVTANATVTSVSSTRCQNCRHRCKSSADLYIHMQTCQATSKYNTEQTVETKSHDSNETVQDRESEPHPMENVVFVWNNIGRDQNKYETPLDISINDDSTLPAENRTYDPNNVDALHDNEGINLSPTQVVGKKVFKCPHCPFWASTASRFHVHIVGHLNKKPFECSLCKYKSNWRWDITKHIKLKSARDPQHNDAKVLMTDETGRRNYSKYNKFLAILSLDERGQNEFHYIDQSAISVDPSMDIDESPNESKANTSHETTTSVLSMQPLNLQVHSAINKQSGSANRIEDDGRKPKKTLWKCKKCNYKDPSKEALLEHVRQHSKQNEGFAKKNESSKDPGDMCYRCGHCNQLSNWKHVIQRHCRLKHDGVIKVIATERPKQDSSMGLNEVISDICSKCPFKTNDRKQLLMHLQQHTPSPQSIFKCYFCQYFVKTENELLQHLVLHGVTDPEDYIAKAMGCKSPIPEAPTSSKRHKCTECPYETNSKSQYMYHEQFHRLPADTPYKCQECNYSVSKRHLLHQHMRVHGIIPQKKESEEPLTAPVVKIEPKTEPVDTDDIPYVWVSAKNEFHKMYKCRYCSYVNSQKCKIPNHEKIHIIMCENSDIIVYKCLECKFTCNNAGRLTDHSKTHDEIYGRIYCPVELDVPDYVQIARLRQLLEEEKKVIIEALNNKGETTFKGTEEEKLLYFCQKCPARFFVDSELRIHDKFHETAFANKCKSCVFSVPIESQLAAHIYVHSDEYQDKTKMLRIIHEAHPDYKEPKLELVHCPATSEITWIVAPGGKANDTENNNKKGIDCKQTPRHYICKQCPAKFFKTSALNYHMSLHGADGDHKCKKCNYSVNNIGNLAKHELLHETDDRMACDYESGEDIDFKNIPLSGTDLFHRKTEAQKRVLNDKDKLVKPNDHFPPVLQADPQFGYLMHGNPEFIYPTYLKNGRQKEKRYKCHKCPSAFEKREQYKIHLSLHGSKQRYKCELCDYSVKYYANYVQHMRKHQMNAEAQAERKKDTEYGDSDIHDTAHEDSADNIKLAIKTMPKSAPKSDFQQFSISDQQTLRLLQRRRSNSNSFKELSPSESPSKDRPKDRKTHMCGFCPYTNQRRDALDNHFHRHKEFDSDAAANHKCCHCDFSVVQSHFLREHLKTHFNIQKTLQPQYFARNEGVIITIMKMNEPETGTNINILESEDKNHPFYTNSEEKVFVKISSGDIVA